MFARLHTTLFFHTTTLFLHTHRQKKQAFKIKFAEARAKEHPDLAETYASKIKSMKAAGALKPDDFVMCFGSALNLPPLKQQPHHSHNPTNNQNDGSGRGPR
jgi:hypothetical protein